MKKSILFLATLLCTLAANATIHNVSSSLSWWVAGDDSPVQAGDTLLVADGEYVEQWSYAYRKEGLVVMAAEGAKPVIKANSYMQHYATTTFIGITFDGQNAAEYASYSYDNTAKSLTFINCEFKNYTEYTISASSSAHVDSLIFENCVLDGSNTTLNTIYAKGTTNTIRITDSEIKGYTASCVTISSSSTIVNNLLIDGCTFDGGSKTLAAVQSSGIINTCEIKDSEIKGFTEYGFVANSSSAHTEELSIDNCIIHDCGYAAVYVCKASNSSEKQSCSDFKLTNSTIYNVGNNTKDHGAVDIRDNANITTSTQEVLIDHVTLYNFNTQDWYGGFMIYQSANATISNCIVSNPADLSGKNGYHIYGNALVTNSLYNNCSVISGAQEANNIAADPLFVDAANGNFQLYAESPAIGLGDPRWGVKPGLQPGSGKLKEAVDAAQPGDVIVLGDETYEVSTSIDFDVEGLTIKAAEGTKPIIKTTDKWTELKISASTTFEGITFDGGNLTKVSVSTFGTTTQTLTLKNCEFKNYTDCNVNIASETSINTIAIENCVFDGGASTPNAIYSKGIATTCTIENTEFKNYTTHCISAGDYYRGRFDNLSINNCLFHDSPVAVYMPTYADAGDIQTCDNFSLTNSTIYNMVCTTSNAVIDIRSNPNDAIEDLNKVVIDHITIYNFDATYGAIYIAKTNDMSITNSIIATPEDKGQRALYVYGGTVDNTIHFNGSKRSGNTVYTKCENTDPLFVDAANGNFKLSANSPAVGAGTNGSNLGDPRWGVSASIKGKVINVTPDQAGDLPWMIQSDESNVKAGDTIVLAAGTYELSSFELRKEGLVVMAAEGAKPVVNMSSYLKHYATVTFIGITFDAKNNGEHAIYSYENTAKNLILKSCVFSNYPKYMLTSNNTAHIDSVIIDDCIFNNSGRSVVYYPQATLDDNVPTCSYFKMTNSTVYNVGNYSGVAAIDIRENQNALGTGGNEIIIDHITMYNFATAYGAILVQQSPKTTISNSIIANPTNSDLRAFLIYSGAKVKNSLHFNTTAEWVSNAYTDTIKADPLFVDAANGNFKLKGNSLAVYAGTDGTTLGDPRWGITPLELNGEGDDAKVLSNYNGKVADVKITRDFVTGDGYNTICLPFDMPANKIGNAYQIETINAYANDEIEVKFAPVTTLLAGQPYLIVPNKTELEEVKQVTITNQAGTTNTVSGGGVSIKMTGVLSENGTTSGLYWVGEQGWLYNGDVRKLGLRAYFEIDINTPSGIAPRMRVVTSENEATGLDNITTNEKAIKAIVNGQLVIIRGGEMYNVQGQKL